MLKQTRAHKPKGLHEVHDSTQRRWANGGADGSKYSPKGLLHLKKDLDPLSFPKPIKNKAIRGKIEFVGEDGEFIYHTIVQGETLGGLAKRYLGEVDRYPELVELNSGTIYDANKIYPGQVIRVPALTPNSA